MDGPTGQTLGYDTEIFTNAATEDPPSVANVLDLPVNTAPIVSVAVQTAMYIVTAVLTVLSNALNLVVLYRNPNCFDEVTQLVLKSLAITDLLTGLFCTSLTVTVSLLRHLRLTELCAIRRCFCSCFVNLSSLFVAFACLDRFLAITRPLRYHVLVTTRRAQIAVAGITIFGVLVGAFSVFPSAKTTLCISNFSSNSGLLFRPSIVITLIVFFICLAIAMYTNSRVVCVAVQQSYRVSNETLVIGNASDAPVRRPKLRGLTAVVMATSAYCVAVIPWAIVSASQMNPSTSIATPNVRFFTSLLLLSNSYWNALIFSMLSNKFRAAVKKTLGISRNEERENVTMSSIVTT